jgi:cysteine-rich repeat protein
VTIVRPVCGNGILEHGEACDDGRPQAGVSCARCHKVLRQPLESEVGVANDDYTNSMALRPEGGFSTPFNVAGSLSVCDNDMFDFDADAGRRVVISLRPSTAGASCPAGVTLALQRTDRPVGDALTAVPATVPEASAETRDGCPVVVLARAARDGVYFARVSAPRVGLERDFAYQLSVQVSDPE